MDRLMRLLRLWRLDREISRNLKARKQLRPFKQQAALKGWQTRRAKA